MFPLPSMKLHCANVHFLFWMCAYTEFTTDSDCVPTEVILEMNELSMMVDQPFHHVSMKFCTFECVLLDILLGHLREMHGKLPVVTCYFWLCFRSSCGYVHMYADSTGIGHSVLVCM